jgi:imidazolonepropionase-like amidohydrolase
VALALSGLAIWDGVSDTLQPGPRVLRTEGASIAALGGPERLRGLGSDVEQLDLTGAVALPGLCDAHVHLSLDPARREAAQDASSDPLDAMAARARQMLEAGITSARDLGGPEFRALELRDAIARGDVLGPRLLCAGQPVTSPRGHCWFWGGEARGLDEIRAVVRRQVERGADCIKVMATGGVLTSGTKPGEAQFESLELETLVAEARAHGRSVAAHCHGTEGIARAARARVRTIEHCSFAGADGFGSAPDAGVVAAIAASGAWVSPTVNTGFARFFAEDGVPKPFAARMGEVYGQLRRAGVPFVASTDAGIPGVAHHRLPESLAVFAKIAGIRPVDALRAATSEAARALELERVTGRLAPGLAADVLVVDGNPLEDLAALTRPRLVIARGRVVYRA